MAVRLATIINMLEDYAPPALVEEWDNSGLQLGDPQQEISKVLLALDVNLDVVQEAIKKQAEAIISHHPLIFKPLKNLHYNTPRGELLVQLIKNNISVYSAHTNLDKAKLGVNDVLAKLLGLGNQKLLHVTDREQYFKLVVFVPIGYEDPVRVAMSAAGAGFVGNYSDCAFSVQGTGMYRPLEGTKPFIGEHFELTRTEEVRLETIVPVAKSSKVIGEMLKAHPYEEVAYDLYPLENCGPGRGLGVVGSLAKPMPLAVFADKVKLALGIKAVRVGGDLSGPVGKVAVFGGSGSSLWKYAAHGAADVLVTGDISHHTAQDMLDAGLSFIDAGHYATERPVIDRLAQYLKRCNEKHSLGLAVIVSGLDTNPFAYV